MTVSTWQRNCVAHLNKALSSNSLWQSYVSDKQNDQDLKLHLAVCAEPYLYYILDGTKTVESRFSSVKCPPFERVSKGDLIFLKKVSGPIVGLCRVESATFYELTPNTFNNIRDEFSQGICPAPGFWEARVNAAFATLITISQVQRIEPFWVTKRDRRGWVTFSLPEHEKQQCLYD